MLLKFKKGLFITLFCVFISFITFSITSYTTAAVNAETYNPSSDINCSKYLNILHNDIYSTRTTVSVLKFNPKYNIGMQYKATYKKGELIASEKMLQANVGFKCNGIFYSDAVELSENGKYVFKVYACEEVDGIKKPTGNPIETVTVSMNNEHQIEFKKNNFYFEHYGSIDALMNDILNSFNMSVTIIANSASKISNYYNNYLKVHNASTFGEDYSDRVNVLNEKIGIVFDEENLTYTINLLSTSSKSLSENFITDVKEMTKDIPNIAFDVINNPGAAGNIVETYLSQQLDISNLINKHEAQNITFSLSSDTVIPSMTSSNDESTIRTIVYDITDKTLNKTYKYSRIIAFYNANFIKKGNGELVVKIKENCTFRKNEVVDINNFITDAYFAFEFNGINYKDYYKVKTCKLKSPVDTTSLGMSSVDVVVTDRQNKIYNKNFRIQVVDDFPPIVLTQYNLLLVEKGNNTYLSQIKVIDNDAVDLTKTSFSLSETSDKGGYVTVNAVDKTGLETTVTIPFLYKTEPTFFQKTIGKVMYEYGQFLRKIF